jgi:ankyrin repeat protein
MSTDKILDAARHGDIETTRACIDASADLAALNKYGFTALQAAAMG